MQGGIAPICTRHFPCLDSCFLALQHLLEEASEVVGRGVAEGGVGRELIFADAGDAEVTRLGVGEVEAGGG